MRSPTRIASWHAGQKVSKRARLLFVLDQCGSGSYRFGGMGGECGGGLGDWRLGGLSGTGTPACDGGGGEVGVRDRRGLASRSSGLERMLRSMT